MFCSKCGRQLTENQKFCPSCGMAVRKIPKSDPKTDPSNVNTPNIPNIELDYEKDGVDGFAIASVVFGVLGLFPSFSWGRFILGVLGVIMFAMTGNNKNSIYVGLAGFIISLIAIGFGLNAFAMKVYFESIIGTYLDYI